MTAPPTPTRAEQARDRDDAGRDTGSRPRPGSDRSSGGGDVGRRRAAARPVPSAGTTWKVLAVLGVLGTIAFGLAWRGAEGRAVGDDGLSPAAEEMRTAGRDFAIALTNFEAATIDRDFDRILSFAAGSFAEEADRFYDDAIRAQLRDAQATSRSEVRDLYVQSFDGTSGQLFAVVDQTIANNLSPRPVSDTLRIDLGMRVVDGEWKVTRVDVLDAPTSSQAASFGAGEATTGPDAGAEATPDGAEEPADPGATDPPPDPDGG